MTAPRPEIQRWTTSLDAPFARKDDGEIVFYSDHLRFVTLAKIEVLESLLSEEMVPMRHSNGYAVRAVPQVSFLNKIAALRKELERWK